MTPFLAMLQSNPSVVLTGISVSVVVNIGTMIYLSIKVGEYKRTIEGQSDDIKEIKTQQVNYLSEVVDLAKSVGNLEGQLERMNGRGH